MRFLIVLITLFFGVCCVDAPAKIQEPVTPEVGVQPVVPLPKYFTVSTVTAEMINSWGPLKAVIAQMISLRKVHAQETLALKLEELEAACKDLEAAPFPEPFEVSEIRSRVKVMRTFVQKTKAEMSYNLDYTPALLQVVRTYNAMLRQVDRVAQQEDPAEIPF